MTTQYVSQVNPFVSVKVTPNFGYTFKYYEVNGEKFTDPIIRLDKVIDDTVITVYNDYATKELPVVSITATGAINSEYNYTDMTFSISNCEGELSNISGGIRLRGNSSVRYAKKPYRIKFDEKQSLFGLKRAKSWVLLAEYIDPSALHNYTAMSLGNQSDALRFTASAYKVNLYLNGEFMGLYTMCEQVQENTGRLNIERLITEDMSELSEYNFFISMDKSSIKDIDAVLGETYFYLPKYDKYFDLKYPKKEDFCSEQQFRKFFDDLVKYTEETLDILVSGTEEQINERINMNSLIDFCIIDNIMGEADHVYKSFNMFYTITSSDPEENGKLSFGPIWDYDWSLNTPWTNSPNQYYTISMNTIAYGNFYFRAIRRFDSYQALFKERYENVFKDHLTDYITNFDALAAGMAESIELNNQKWYRDFDSEMSNKNLRFLKDFLITRKEVLDNLR